MSHGSDYILKLSGYEIELHHPTGIRTWFHPTRETQLARLTAVMIETPGAIVVHDIETKSGDRLVRQIKLNLSDVDPRVLPTGVVEMCESPGTGAAMHTAGVYRSVVSRVVTLTLAYTRELRALFELLDGQRPKVLQLIGGQVLDFGAAADAIKPLIAMIDGTEVGS